jgi:c-di-GMP-binding flagellar brake protein YcgR
MSERTIKPNNERRRYFRVTDLVGLRYQPLSEDQQALAIQARPGSLKELLKAIDNQILASLAIVQGAHPEVYRALELLNQKINIALNAEQLLDNESLDHSALVSVNLSACGIAFSAELSANLNQYLAIELTLYPNNIRMNLMAAVIGCEAYQEEDGKRRYLIRADFIDISDASQEVLVQHVIKRQAQQLKQQRGE